MVFSRYSAVGKMEDCYSESGGFEPVSSTLPFVDMKSSNEHNAAWCLRALLVTEVVFCSCVYSR